MFRPATLLTASKFSVYELEYLKLKRGLHPKRLKYSDNLDLSLWTDSNLIKTMKALLKAENQGYILKDDLIDVIGSDQINSLVNYNFLYCRQNSNFAYDIIKPPDKIILIAMNQPSLHAMKQVLSELK
ncbi:unnamed protein product [Rhizophagus irregularis]|nr:unnamed protein product [Rhizophagus irregularis]